jgi:hypothetical protein
LVFVGEPKSDVGKRLKAGVPCKHDMEPATSCSIMLLPRCQRPRRWLNQPPEMSTTTRAATTTASSIAGEPISGGGHRQRVRTNPSEESERASVVGPGGGRGKSLRVSAFTQR